MLALAAVLLLVGAPAAHAQYVPGTPGFIISPSTAAPGEVSSITGQGCPPGSQVVFTINGQVIATTVASNDSAGSFSTQFTVPNLPPGTYTVLGTCGNVSMSQSFTITSGSTNNGASSTTSGGLANTGADPGPMIKVALALFVVGGLLVLAARRKQTADT